MCAHSLLVTAVDRSTAAHRKAAVDRATHVWHVCKPLGSRFKKSRIRSADLPQLHNRLQASISICRATCCMRLEARRMRGKLQSQVISFSHTGWYLLFTDYIIKPDAIRQQTQLQPTAIKRGDFWFEFEICHLKICLTFASLYEHISPH